MRNAVCALSHGICACCGSGAERAFDYASGKLPDAFSKNALFESPRHGDKLFGIAPLGETRAGFSRCKAMLFDAAKEALSKIDISKAGAAKISVFFGTSIGGIFEAENMLARNIADPDRADWRELSQYECSTLADALAKHFGFGGERATYSTACSSSSLALADACNAIAQNDCDIAVVCGADALSRITVNGFGSLLLLSHSRAKPFDAGRDGINLGEAAAVLVLASQKTARKAGFSPMAYIGGWACTADAYHATAPRPDGAQAARAVEIALASAGLKPADISFYIAHGTATKGNDSAEFAALRRVFGENIPPYASVKRAFGHTLGASGILNAVLAVEALRRDAAMPNLGLETAGEEFNPPPNTKAQKLEMRNIASVSLGFGGNNSAAIISKTPPYAPEPQKRRIFAYACGEVKTKDRQSCAVDAAELLADVPALKKRRLAKMQQMGLECAEQIFARTKPKISGEKIGVCFGTGAAMTAETARFVEATILKNEAEPIPSAFTNSVHNAVASAVSLKYAFTGLNGAATAKEISFETALKEARREICSGAIDAAVVGACDECCAYAEKFLTQNAKFTRDKTPPCDYACAYFVGAPDAAENPLAEILEAEISRRGNLESESEFLKNLFAKNGLSPERAACYATCAKNKFQIAHMEKLFEKLGAKAPVFTVALCGRSYSASACVLKNALETGASAALSYTLSSSGQRAAVLFKML